MIKLKKSFFSRNKSREKEWGDIFNKTSNVLSKLVAIGVTIFYTPKLVITTLFCKEMLVILANIFLTLGYLTNFGYRIYQGQVSASELIVSLLALTALITGIYFLSPAIAVYSFINIILFANKVAAIINLFFLVKDVLVPPCKKFIENVVLLLGYDISGRYYTKPLLTVEQDRYIVDLLCTKTYKHDSYSPLFTECKLVCFNKLLLKLCSYIDKYDESVLGYIKNKDKITTLEHQIMDLTTKANANGGYAFIKKKLSFKTTKINNLCAARDEIKYALEHPQNNVEKTLRFFSGVRKYKVKNNKRGLLRTGLNYINKEIRRQENKKIGLEECLPKLEM